MRGYEVALFLGALLIVAVIAVWLALSQIWGRRRIPPRLILPAEVLSQEPGVAIPVQGEPRRIVFAHEPRVTEEAWDWPTKPPSRRVFDQDNPRPWAHERV